jgi:hypothetical protein
VLAVLSGSAGTAFWVGVEFGAVRGLTLLVVAPARTPARLRALVARIDTLDAASLRVAARRRPRRRGGRRRAGGGPVAAAVAAVALGLLVLAPRMRVAVTPAGRAPEHGEPDQPGDDSATYSTPASCWTMTRERACAWPARRPTDRRWSCW